MPDWVKWLISGLTMPVTTGLTALTGNDNPLEQIINGDINGTGSLGASSGVGPTPGTAGNSEDPSGANIPISTTINGDTGLTNIDTALGDALQGSVSLSDYIKNNPGQSPEDYLGFMAQNNDDWAEKFLDYYLDKQAISEANAYTASREDTAYQRLVADLKAAGLNPAMMYGSTAATHASGSAGIASTSSGANSSSINNFTKLKKLLLSYMLMQIGFATGMTNSLGKGLTSILGML